VAIASLHIPSVFDRRRINNKQKSAPLLLNMFGERSQSGGSKVSSRFLDAARHQHPSQINTDVRKINHAKYHPISTTPRLLTDELQNKICKYVREGNTYRVAAKLCRISEQTLMNWLMNGEASEESSCRGFYEAVREAEAEAERKVVSQWQKLNETTPDWRSYQAFLAQRFNWNTVKKVEITMDQTSLAPTRDLSKLTVEELREYQRLLSKTEEPGQIIEMALNHANDDGDALFDMSVPENEKNLDVGCDPRPPRFQSI